MRIRSKLLEYDADKGVGYTRCEGYLKKIRVRKNNLKSGTLKEGDEIEFEVIEWEAENITLPDTPVSNVVDISVSKKIRKEEKACGVLHLYMPWNPGYISDQMYQLKSKISDKKRAWIPKINSTQGKADFNLKIIDIINTQLEAGIETCLYMTNFNCIHIWKISGIHMGKDLPASEQEATLADYARKGYTAEFWIKVTDVYVLQADHDGKLTPILIELEKLSICELNSLSFDPKSKITPYMSAQRYPAPVAQRDRVKYFANVMRTTFTADKEEVTAVELWLNTHRKVTKEYNLMHEYVKKNIYPNMWDTFNKRSQHFLIELEMLKIESSAYSFMQSLQYAKQIFECYVSALLNELDEMIAEKVLKIAYDYNLKSIEYNDNNFIRNSIIRLNGTKEPPDLTFYRNLLSDSMWLTNLKKLKNQLNNPQDRNIINDMMNFANGSDFRTKLSTLTILRNWFAHDYFHVISLFVREEQKQNGKELIESLTTIMNLISSPYSNSNLFCDVFLAKNKKAQISFNNDFQKLVNDLKTIYKKTA